MRTILAGTALLFLSVAVAYAQEPTSDPVAMKIDAARKAFEERMRKIREPIFRKFDEADSKAREKADLATVKSVKKERAEFEEKGILPKRFATGDYVKEVEKSRREMMAVYQKGVGDYLKLKEDVLAEKTSVEMEVFRKTQGVDPNKIARERLYGDWKIMSSVIDGKDLPGIRGENWIVRYEVDKFTLTTNGRYVISGTWSVDTTKTPTELDEHPVDGIMAGKTKMSIIELDGDVLRSCIGASRPEKFESLPSQKRQLSSLSRVRP